MQGVEIIAPPQYSVAWLILAFGASVLIIVIIVVIARVSRAFFEAQAYRRRPGPQQALRAEFERSILAVAEKSRAGEISERDAFRDLEAIMRAFVVRTQGVEVSTASLRELLADPATLDVGRVIAQLHPGSYARDHSQNIDALCQRCLEVVRQWS